MEPSANEKAMAELDLINAMKAAEEKGLDKADILALATDFHDGQIT